MRESIKHVVVHGGLVAILRDQWPGVQNRRIESFPPSIQTGGILADALSEAGYGPGVFADFNDPVAPPASRPRTVDWPLLMVMPI